MRPIGAFSRICSVSANTLRYYDEIGLLKPVHVNGETGYRYYDDSQMETLIFINKLKGYDFSLEEIADVLQSPEDDALLLRLSRWHQRDLLQRIRRYQAVLSQLEADITNLERGKSMMSYMEGITVKLVECEPMHVVSVREIINVEEYGKILGKVMERVEKEKRTVIGAPMCIYHNDEYAPDSYDTEAAIPVAEAENTTLVPGGLCAVATVKGPYSQLPATYVKLEQWMTEQGYRLAGSPREVYLTDPSQTKPQDFLTEVCFPVEKIGG